MTLTPEQQQAIDRLLDHVPPEYRRDQPDPASPGRPVTPFDGQTVERSEGQAPASPEKTGGAPDLLQTWLGISGSDLKARVMAVLGAKDRLEGRFLDWSEGNPLDAAFEFILASAYAFYAAEKGHNPKIQTYVDSLYYIATCASVGYADIFAITQTGKTIAALVMIVGPALTNKALERPG